MRDDLSTKLIHFTKGSNKEAAGTFLKILSENRLLGGTGYIKGAYRCVCFTESPIGKLVHILANRETYHFNYAPFGVMVDKLWLWERGGRPVIYQSDEEFELLDHKQKYRHKIYEPDKDIDFTWEREWRIQTQELMLDPENTTIIVPNKIWVDQLLDEYMERIRLEVCGRAVLTGGWFAGSSVSRCPWHFIALEDLGIKIKNTEVLHR